MQTVKLKLSSIVGLITNSSSVVYSWAEDSVDSVKVVLAEVLKLMGETKTVDELFYVMAQISNDDITDRWLDNMEDEEANKIIINGHKGREITYDDVDIEMTRMLKGEIEIPQWYKDAQEYEDYDGIKFETELCILPKEEKYQVLANELIHFLYSTQLEGGYNG